MGLRNHDETSKIQAENKIHENEVQITIKYQK